MTERSFRHLPYRPCVGIMLVNPSYLVFAGQRIDGPPDAWQMPQGGIDPGEAHRDAALRELREETGVPPESVEILAEARELVAYDLPPDLVNSLWGGQFRGQLQSWYLMRFLGDDTVIDIASEEPEFNRWAWLPVSELTRRIVPFKRDAYARVVEEFSAYFPWGDGMTRSGPPQS